jgi:Na+-transporting NADH:ubiquinone oxidoreductase subunit A
MGKVIKIKRGKNISLVGKASNEIVSASAPSTFAIKPTDFKGLVPKMVVKQGDEVKAGDILFTDKKNSRVCFTSPVSGEVAEVVRGERRAIQAVVILADATNNYKEFNTSGYESKSSDELKELLLTSGLWPYLVQRPFGTIAEIDAQPKAIHISGFDSAPLAADLAITLEGQEKYLQAGINALSKFTDGKIHLNLHQDSNNAVYNQITGVEKNMFSGPHPSGLVGIQIHHIDPINKGDVVWTIKPQHVAFIGKFLETGKLDLEQKVVIAGSEVKKPAYYNLRVGSSLEKVLENNLNSENVRVISGDVLTGSNAGKKGYLSFFNNQITVIPEGDDYEFFGWLIPSYARPTISSSLPISKFLKKTFKVNTNFHGEPRAFVVSGEYEKVLPMDVMPVQLLKSVLAMDLEQMENLGIYEVIEEDMALCEFVCTSKQEVQSILSEGLELMAEEG